MSSNVYALAFGAYLLFSIADACIKAVGARLGVFEIAFSMNLVAIAVIVVVSRDGEHWRNFWKTPQPFRVLGRAACGLVSGIGSVYALSNVPLVDVYALLFLSPFFVTIMSMAILRERVGMRRWVAVAIGFAGVLLTVRPGFRELDLGHLAALAAGLGTGCSIIIMRSLDPAVRRTSVLGTLFACALAMNLTMILVVGFKLPDLRELAILVVAGITMGLGQLALLAATRSGKASQVAPAAYSPLVWALVIGALFFGEIPDLLAIVGTLCIVAAGLVTVFREGVRGARPTTGRAGP